MNEITDANIWMWMRVKHLDANPSFNCTGVKLKQMFYSSGITCNTKMKKKQNEDLAAQMFNF